MPICISSTKLKSQAHTVISLAFRSEMFFNHLEERLLDQAQVRASFTPLFWGRSRSIPQCMVSNI